MPNHCTNKLRVPRMHVDKLTNLLKDGKLANNIVPVDPESTNEDRIAAWGTKWGDYEGTQADLVYYFETAWSTFHTEFLDKLAEVIPDFYLTYYEPGCDFGGYYEYLDGEHYAEDEFDYYGTLMFLEEWDFLFQEVQWRVIDLQEEEEEISDDEQLLEAVKVLQDLGYEFPNLNKL